MNWFLPVISLLLAVPVNSAAGAADFRLEEKLGHHWSHERVTFALTDEQAGKAASGKALTGNGGQEIPYQLLRDTVSDRQIITFQTDLPPFEHREFRFSQQPASATTDLVIRETEDELKIENEWIGLAVRKRLVKGQGPVAAMRLRSGKWVGSSSLVSASAVRKYLADITARGPVLTEVRCRIEFGDGGKWTLRFRIESGEPVVLVEEQFDAPAGGAFRLYLDSGDFTPTRVLYRSGKGGTLGQVSSGAIGEGKVFTLEPWLQWWKEERRGNWLGLYDDTPGPQAETPNGLLMIGLLRPAVWKNPNWSGRAKHVDLVVPVSSKQNRVAAEFPLGGGSRVWMMGAPDQAESLAPLSAEQRKLAPLPHKYLIKHGDFPLDEIKDYVLSWDHGPQQHPRLFIGRDDVEAMREILDTDLKELERWERRQPIDKYNIKDPLRVYFASGSEQLGDKIVDQSAQWLQTVVVDDLLEQEARVTLGFAPHNQAVLLLPTLNLTDAALGVETISAQQREIILARLAFLGYVVNSANYWSPERGFSANPNMTTTVAHYQVVIASLIPTHPMAGEWAARGLATLRRQLLEWSDAEGGWLEAPHYALVAYDHMLAAFIMAQRAGFSNDLYDDRMRKVIEWLARISTPPNPRTGNSRHLPPIGNTYYGEASAMFCIVAGLWQERDPGFAARMQWMCEEQGTVSLGLGWSFPSMTGYTDFLQARGVKAETADFGSAWFPETGVVLRTGSASPRETYLHLIAGSNHEHYDYDSGSVVIWGKGSLLADDWGYIGRHAAEFHNLLTAPLVRGEMRVENFSTQELLDYVSGLKVSWRRQVSLVKDDDPLGSNFFFIRDRHHVRLGSAWRLWLAVEPGRGRVDLHSHGATVSGADDIDFDLFFYRPENLGLKIEQAEQDARVANLDGRVGPVKLNKTAVIATPGSLAAVSCLVYPRLKWETAPQVIWHANGRIAQVILEEGTDYVFMASPTGSDEGREFRTSSRELSFSGSSGLVRVRNNQTVLSLGAPGTIRFGDKSLISDAPVTEQHSP